MQESLPFASALAPSLWRAYHFESPRAAQSQGRTPPVSRVRDNDAAAEPSWNSIRKGCGLMSLPDERSAASQAEIGETLRPGVPGLETDSSAGPISALKPSGRTWAMVLGAGLLAGLASFAIGEAAPSLV